jgi:protease secretion system membrane fusion protein
MKSLIAKYAHDIGPQKQGWLVMIFGFLGFVIWASTYPIDQGIPGAGFVIPKSEKISISSPASSAVISLLKKSGDHVVAGEVIVQLDPLSMQSSLQKLEESAAGLKGTIKTLELAFEARQQQVALLKKQFSQSKQVVDAGFVSQQSALKAKSEHVKLLESQYEANKKLFDAGFLSKNGLEKSKAELAWAQGETYDLGSKNEQVVTNSVQNLSSINTQISLAQSELLQARANIEENRSRVREIEEQIKAVKHELTLLKIVSPVDGTLMNLSIKSAGVNVTLGQQLLEIVPDSDQLTVEVRVPVEYADRVFKGMSVDIMFPSLSGSSTKQVKGVLSYVSGDKVVDQKTGQTFLEARVVLRDLADVAKLKLRVGLPASVLFNTGPRTLMSYMLRPFKDRVSMGLQ